MPRSGTTWAANWLTADGTLCLHGLSGTKHRTEWDSVRCGNRRIGVSDTVIGAFPEWLNDHPARKVILHRPVAEIHESFGGEIEVPTVDLSKINGFHVHWTDLFERPMPIWNHLMNATFDPVRHEMLVGFQINTIANKVNLDVDVCRRLVSDMQERLNERDRRSAT